MRNLAFVGLWLSGFSASGSAQVNITSAEWSGTDIVIRADVQGPVTVKEVEFKNAAGATLNPPTTINEE